MNTRKVTNYLNNKDMLAEIHKSKCSFCEFDDFEKHHQFDIILNSTDEIAYNIEGARDARAKRESKILYEEALYKFDMNSEVKVKPKVGDHVVDSSEIPIEDLVFRVVTYEHIPKDSERKKNPKKTAEHHVKLNFIPFKHYILSPSDATDDSTVSHEGSVYKIVEVGRSHSRKGKFSDAHGSITPTLAKMFVLLVNRYSHRANWRGYSYVDEMRGQALCQLAYMGLMFDESKSNNPFAYFTTSISNSFTRILNFEKKQQNMRDDLLESQGKTPSYTRQLENDEYINRVRSNIAED
jgi:hypothetical protein